MLDMDESLRALYHAPIPLVVLHPNRTIKMLNLPAEKMLGSKSLACVGDRLDTYFAPPSRPNLAVALNKASHNLCQPLNDPSVPTTTRLQLEPMKLTNLVTTVDLYVTAWFATDTLFASNSREMNEMDFEIETPSPMASSAQFAEQNRLLGAASNPHAHEAFFTVSMMPFSVVLEEEKESTPQGDIAKILQEVTFDNITIAVCALSKDGSIEIRNEACEEILSFLPAGYSSSSTKLGLRAKGKDFRLLSWMDETLTIYDENFQYVYPPAEWPLNRCAFEGKSMPDLAMGVESKLTGERIVVQVSSKVLYHHNGLGQHIGGLLTFRDITSERRKLKMDAELIGDTHFKEVLDTMPQLTTISSNDSSAVWYSKPFLDYTGKSEDELIGGGWQDVLHAEDNDALSSTWSQSLRTGDPIETAFRLQRHDGEYRWFLLRSRLMESTTSDMERKWFGICTDIHSQVEALSASRKAQTQLQQVISHADVTLWAVDLQGFVTVAEGPGTKQLKLLVPTSPEEERQNSSSATSSQVASSNGRRHDVQSIIGKSIYEIWGKTNIVESMQKALAGETIVEEMEMDGRWFRTSYIPLRNQSDSVSPLTDAERRKESLVESKIIGVVGASMDITDRINAQKKLEESTFEKTRALAAEGAAREASRLKSQFLANMSHEIRTPIAGIIGISDLMLDEQNLTVQFKDYTETIQRSAEGLLTVINDVLDFSKVEVGKMDVEEALFSLEVVLQDTKKMLSFATQRRGLEYRESIRLAYKGDLLGDCGRLRQILTNLLTNAIKFTDQGHVSLEVVDTQGDANYLSVRFDIHDTGCGINADSLANLFEPFSQADSSTARRYGGTGLGLSISKSLVELMGGQIGLKSVEGKGSHAWFVLPFRKAKPQGGDVDEDVLGVDIMSSFASSSHVIPFHEKASSARPRGDVWVLIAEDNEINARVAMKNVERLGFKCRLATNGLLALEELNRNKYDIILMDCQMPNCDGYEATRMIRQFVDPEIRMLPIIALTASAIKGDRERALEAGMIDYLAKPVKRSALEATLCKWLYDKNARQSLLKFTMAYSTVSSLTRRSSGTDSGSVRQ
ncbi:hypothetical protein CBS101457_004876 [Exobasidium rhododendri]|nr:hypothetical protein CBS101457_004876 [Exobasidium rhododendri]